MYESTEIIGNLAADPIMRYTQNGTPVCNFTVVVNPTADTKKYYEVTAWRKLAETCQQYLASGRLVLVIGNIEARPYTNKKGEAAAALKLNGRLVKFLGSRGHVPTEASDDSEPYPEEDFYGASEIPF